MNLSNDVSSMAHGLLSSGFERAWLSSILPDTVVALPMHAALAMAILAFTMAVLVLTQLLRGQPLLAVLSGGLFRHTGRRDTVLLIGLPSSGKTCLFSALVRPPANLTSSSWSAAHAARQRSRNDIPDENGVTDAVDTRSRGVRTCTSMEPNLGTMHPAHLYDASRSAHSTDSAVSASAAAARIVDYPGHRRLRQGLPAHVATAHKIVVVVDAITVQDDAYEGAVALAELLLSVLQCDEFCGVRALLVACTKRDAMTSYTAKAVRVLTEAAMAQALRSCQGQLGSLEAVRDAKGKVIRGGGAESRLERGGGGAAAAAVRLCVDDESGKFSFDGIGVPVSFVDVSSGGSDGEHGLYSIQPVVNFICAKA